MRQHVDCAKVVDGCGDRFFHRFGVGQVCLKCQRLATDRLHRSRGRFNGGHARPI